MSVERLDIPTAYSQVRFYGDACIPMDGEHDLRGLVAETVCRLPTAVQDWLLYETSPVFIGGHGQDGEFFELWVHSSEFKEGFAVIRVIFLSERLMTMPKGEALRTIAHEIAHSRLKHDRGGYDAEVDADCLVGEWGFTEPATRPADRERYK